jgi:hypothetical protein
MSKSAQQVNYIRHLENFLSIVDAGNAIHFGHVALYVSLFRLWNMHYFVNPFCPSRSEIMSHAGFRSKDAFYRNLKELNAFDLIRYYPSKSRYEHSYFCISTIEHLESGFRVDVWALTHHVSLNNAKTQGHDNDNTTPAPNKPVVDMTTKTKLFNGKGKLILEKSFIIDASGNKVEMQNRDASFNPLTDPKYSTHIDNRILSSSKNSAHANHQNPQSGRSGLRPAGVQVDPDADYSVGL